MTLIADLHHLTFVTADLDRLIAFYDRCFDAEVTLDLVEGPIRHAFIAVGPHTVLHPFEVPGVEPPGPLPMFERGRLDHFALNAVSYEAFRELHRRLDAEGAVDGAVIDMGSLLLFNFTDPDGGEHEVAWIKPGVPIAQGARRDAWTRVALGSDGPERIEAGLP